MAEGGTRIDGLALAAIAAGVLFTFAGVKGKSVLSTVQAVIAGNKPGSASAANTIADQVQTAPAADGGDADVALPAVSGGGSPAANKALGMVLAAAYGWTGTEWDYLESGWEEESGWSTTAANDKLDPYNHAYGIPQANPGTKMASAGADWKTSAYTQIKWGLGYIKATYGSPTRVPNWTANGPTSAYEGY